jgi:hypothetical protein
MTILSGELVCEERRKRMTIVPDEADGRPELARHTPPGDVELLIIEYSSRQHASDSDDDRFLQRWHAKVALTDENGNVVENVGYIAAYI